MRHISYVFAAAMAVAPLTGAFAAGPSPQIDRAFDSAAVTDLHHAGADLAPMRVTEPGMAGKEASVSLRAPSAGRLAAARNWAERAETELLNRASYNADGGLTLGNPIPQDGATGDIVKLREAVAAHELRQARHDDVAAIHVVGAELPAA